MTRVLKYPLKVTDKQTLVLNGGSEVLSVAVQGLQIVMYALVNDNDRGIDAFEVYMHGTGHLAPKATKEDFVGTILLPNGSVFHVFAKKVSNGKID